MMKNKIIIILILAFCISGCTTTPKKAFETGKIYVPLLYVCQKYNLDWQYDTVSGIVTISKNGKEIRLRRDSRLILYDGMVEYLDLEVASADGVLLVPSSFVDKYITAPIALSPTSKLFEIKYIVLDAGHGGHDPGALGRNSLKEKDLTLDIAKKVKQILDGNGIKVILTREDDSTLELEERAQIANDGKADFFVSIHSNASRAKRASGFEVYYLSEDVDDSVSGIVDEENSAPQAQNTNNATPDPDYLDATLRDMANSENRAESIELAKSINKAADELLPVVNRGVKGANFCVLRQAKMPAVLVEIGFISNKRESLRLKDDYYKQMVAEAIAAGILAYKKEFEISNGFTN